MPRFFPPSPARKQALSCPLSTNYDIATYYVRRLPFATPASVLHICPASENLLPRSLATDRYHSSSVGGSLDWNTIIFPASEMPVPPPFTLSPEPDVSPTPLLPANIFFFGTFFSIDMPVLKDMIHRGWGGRVERQWPV